LQRATLLGLLRVNDLTPYLSASLPRFFFSLRVKTNGRPGGARAFTPSARCAQGGQGGRRARQRRPALRGIVAIGMPVITRRRREDDGEPATPPNQARPNKTARGQSQEPFATPATQPPPALPPPTTASPTAVDQAPTPSADHDQEIVATSPPAAARPDLTDDTVSDEEFFYQLVGDLDPAELRGELQAYPANAEGADAQPLAQILPTTRYLMRNSSTNLSGILTPPNSVANSRLTLQTPKEPMHSRSPCPTRPCQPTPPLTSSRSSRRRRASSQRRRELQ